MSRALCQPSLSAGPACARCIRRDGVLQGSDRTATDLVLGVGYGIARGNTLNGTLKLNASGRGGAEFRLNWLYTFQGAAAARSGNRRATGG